MKHFQGFVFLSQRNKNRYSNQVNEKLIIIVPGYFNEPGGIIR